MKTIDINDDSWLFKLAKFGGIGPYLDYDVETGEIIQTNSCDFYKYAFLGLISAFCLTTIVLLFIGLAFFLIGDVLGLYTACAVALTGIKVCGDIALTGHAAGTTIILILSLSWYVLSFLYMFYKFILMTFMINVKQTTISALYESWKNKHCVLVNIKSTSRN